MPPDEQLAERVRGVMPDGVDVTEKRMFGGLAFLVDGHMAVAVSGSGGLLVRVDPADSERLIEGKNVTRMVMRGREMRGWLLVDKPALSGKQLSDWVRRGVDFVGGLPPK